MGVGRGERGRRTLWREDEDRNEEEVWNKMYVRKLSARKRR